MHPAGITQGRNLTRKINLTAASISPLTSVHECFRSGVSPRATWELWFRANGFLLAALGVVGVFSAVVLLLLGCLLYLVSVNCTTWEFMSRHRISYLKGYGDEENPFDRGVFCNLWDFFCVCGTVVWEQVYRRKASNPV